MPKETPEEGKIIGKVTHYFGKIGVAIIKLSDCLETDNIVRIVGGETDFQQTIESIEIEHQKVKKAKKGETIGLKIDQKVREGYKVYKITE